MLNQKNEYFLNDFYAKDIKYLNPYFNRQDSKSIKIQIEENKNKIKRNVLSCGFLSKFWVTEVIKGLKQFLYQGSLHGVKYIFEPSFTRTERLTWIVIVLISIIICLGNIIQLVSQWTSSPFVNVIDSLPTPVWAVPFPTIVLCPHLHVQLSFGNVGCALMNATTTASQIARMTSGGMREIAYLKTGLPEMLVFPTMTGIFLSYHDGLEQFFASLVCSNMNIKNKYLDKRLNNEQHKLLQDFIVQSSPKCSDVVKRCYWRGLDDSDTWRTKDCCDKLFQPIYTNYGFCFAFNSLPLNGMYGNLHIVCLHKSNATIPWQQTFNNHAEGKKLEWDLDSGYPKMFPPDMKLQPLRVMASGELNGLGLELYYNTSEHQFACDGSNIGFHIFINSPMDNAYTSTVLRLPMSRSTTIEVSPVKYGTDSTLRKLSADKRQCFFQTERKLDNYLFYTDSNCKHDLLMCEAKKQCNCVMFNWPRKDISDPICVTRSDYDCITKVQGKVEEQLIYAYYADTKNSILDEAVDSLTQSCHPSCNDIMYTSQAYYSNLEKELREDDTCEGSKKTGEITRMNVYFYDDILLGQPRHAQYDDFYFVGAIGGLLSLFLGFSIISVAELVYFVFLRPVFATLKEMLRLIYV